MKRLLAYQHPPGHIDSKRRVGGEGYSFRNKSGGKPRQIAGLVPRQIKSLIEKGLTTTGNIGGVHNALAVLAR